MSGINIFYTWENQIIKNLGPEYPELGRWRYITLDFRPVAFKTPFIS